MSMEDMFLKTLTGEMLLAPIIRLNLVLMVLIQSMKAAFRIILD